MLLREGWMVAFLVVILPVRLRAVLLTLTLPAVRLPLIVAPLPENTLAVLLLLLLPVETLAETVTVPTLLVSDMEVGALMLPAVSEAPPTVRPNVVDAE